MLKVSLDTNAILDLCYRAYPEVIFSSLWHEIELMRDGNFIKFYLCESANSEVLQQISNHDLDESIYTNFLKRLHVEIISSDEFGQDTLFLKKELLKFPASQSSKHVTADNYADLDIISLAKSLGNTTVLTCEQKAPIFNWDNKGHKSFLKVPNICEKFAVNCGNWPHILELLGIKFQTPSI